jgi:hypothetical protein
LKADGFATACAAPLPSPIPSLITRRFSAKIRFVKIPELYPFGSEAPERRLTTNISDSAPRSFGSRHFASDITVARPSFPFYGLAAYGYSPSPGWRHGAIELAADGVEKGSRPRGRPINSFKKVNTGELRPESETF